MDAVALDAVALDAVALDTEEDLDEVAFTAADSAMDVALVVASTADMADLAVAFQFMADITGILTTEASTKSRLTSVVPLLLGSMLQACFSMISFMSLCV
jgi:hypothetical protein